MDEPVHQRPDVGHAIIALHDPVRGRETAFDEWYEADHMLAAGTMAPWTIGGMRWVADRDLKALRYPADGPFGPATRGSFMMLFWIQRDRLAEQQAWVTEAMADIAAQDRNFADRDAVTATTYDAVRSVARDEPGVPPVLALAHHFPGAVLVVAERAADGSAETLAGWLLDTHLGPRLAGSSVALVMAFAPRPKEPWWPPAYPEVEGVGTRLFLVCFTDTDPRDDWTTLFAPLGDALAASGTGHLLLAAPFVPTPAGLPTDPTTLW